MRRKAIGAVAAVALLAAAFSGLGALSRNVAMDAVSRASTWNEHQGEVAWLTDGLVPPVAGAAPFVWSSKGMLAFEWDKVLALTQVRLCVGEADSDFEIRTYVGGRLTDDGATRDPVGERTATVLDQSAAANAWIVFDLPAGTLADNLELKTVGRAELYELEIIAQVEDTAVESQSWARVKANARAVDR